MKESLQSFNVRMGGLAAQRLCSTRQRTPIHYRALSRYACEGRKHVGESPISSLTHSMKKNRQLQGGNDLWGVAQVLTDSPK